MTTFAIDSLEYFCILDIKHMPHIINLDIYMCMKKSCQDYFSVLLLSLVLEMDHI